ncbi:MAG: glycosyltransferase [Bacteroidetes bacterium]|nr:glycosyltransferase [Bacteroidota bacterium]
MLLSFLCGLFIITTLFQMGLWGFFFTRLSRFLQPEKKTNTIPVSVIICARNERENLQKNLPFILSQSHPVFEVIVVDDNSTDGSRILLEQLSQKHTQLRVVDPGETRAGKKDALASGIQAAQYPYLLLTDADCRPASAFWITEMCAPFGEGADLVLGYAPFYPERGVLNRWQRFEAWHTAILYLSAARWGQPYMGVGRNLAYRKSMFEAEGGFESHADLASGDDDLFVNGLMDKNLRVCISIRRKAWMYSRAKKSWSSWRRQKQRHLSTGIRYRRAHKLGLGLIAFSHALHWLLGFIGLWLFPAVAIVGGILRLSLAWWQAVRLMKRFDSQDLIPFFPILDLLLPLYHLWFSLSIFGFRRKADWH